MLLSRNYPPSPALAPFIRRHYVFEANLPADFVILDRLLSETAFVRILLRGDWAAEMKPGVWETAGETVLFGANARPMPVRVTGPFTVAGFGIKPGGWRALIGKSARTFTDRMIPLSSAWGDLAQTMFAAVSTAASDGEIVTWMEAALTAQLARIGRSKEDLLMSRFEALARQDSTAKIEDLAAKLGMSVRQVERRCLDAFGLSPKTVLRRSRFLDMATAMRGFSTPSEEQLAALRYFDQSHLNREFHRFAGMTPGKFRRETTPLFTAGLKLRSEGGELFKLD